MTGPAVAAVVIVLVAGVLVLSARVTGQVAERFGQDARPGSCACCRSGPSVRF